MGNEHSAAQAWSYLCEGGHPLAHALIEATSYEQALSWVKEYGTHSQLSDEIEEAIQRSGARGDYVRRTMQAWQLRLASYQEMSTFTMKRMGISFLIPGDKQWPFSLDDLSAPVFGLWIRGDVDVLSRPAISLVGSRAASSYGKRIARNLACDLSDTHIIVSGGAFGIDAQAHLGALHNGKQTIIVSAGGVDRPYPLAHSDLFTATIAQGAILSESPPGAAPQRHRFLSRNRIIAALGAGTVVVEAPSRSGALSTARHAIDCGRPVGACPGLVDTPVADGCHLLIRNGATLIRNSADVRELVSWQQLTLSTGEGEDIFQMPDDGFDKILEQVWEAIPLTCAATASSIARVAGVSEREALVKLARLELLGRARNVPSGWRRV
ncbi:DNA-processing protein DprA [Arcanobacterium phocae]|uniref:DNA-processing protein DprA n=1 Tax=Arcanobacterium phocae TaxID=131112 RepID=UPI001C0F11B4|nr:DNA-processing protein DprA [Arcanobacterium phocae]